MYRYSFDLPDIHILTDEITMWRTVSNTRSITLWLGLNAIVTHNQIKGVMTIDISKESTKCTDILLTFTIFTF